MVYEPDRMFAVAITVLIAFIAMAVLFTLLFFVLVGIVRLFTTISAVVSSALRRLGYARRGNSAWPRETQRSDAQSTFRPPG